MQFEFDAVAFFVMGFCLVVSYVRTMDGVGSNAAKIKDLEVKLKDSEKKSEDEVAKSKAALENQIEIYRTQSVENSRAIWDRFQTVQSTLEQILVITGEVKGELKSLKRD